MHDAERVRCAYGGEKLGGEPDGLLERDALPRGKLGGERTTRESFHDDEWSAVAELFESCDGDDVRVLEPPENLCLDAHTVEQAGLLYEVSVQNLRNELPPEISVHHAEDLAHATRTHMDEH